MKFFLGALPTERKPLYTHRVKLHCAVSRGTSETTVTINASVLGNKIERNKKSLQLHSNLSFLI